MATAAAGTTPPSEAARASLWLAAVPAVVGLAICLWQLHLPHWWSGSASYDDGVYVGSAIELARGLLPYRDYVFVQPPGITILLAPAALICRAFGYGTQDVVFLSRVLTSVVTALDAALVALAVRHRGAVAMIVGGLAFACFPGANQADSVALLEPYVGLFCLVGIVLLFSNGRIVSGWRVYLAGLSFGMACSFKVWAVLPAGIVFLFACWAGRDRILRFAAGGVTGIALTYGAFFAAAPRALVRDVFSAQVNRLTVQGLHRLAGRLDSITGFNELRLPAWAVVLSAIGFIAAVVLAHVGTPPSERPTVLERCLATVAIIGLVVLLLANPFYGHYPYLLLPEMAILMGSVTSRAARNAARLLAQGSEEVEWRKLAAAIAMTMTALLGAFAAVRSYQSFEQSDFAQDNARNVALISRLPFSTCLVSDQDSLAISANRLSHGKGGCPVLLDSYGIQLVQTATSGDSAKSRAVLAHKWRLWLGRADYVYLSNRFTRRIPWPSWLNRWFHTNFTPVPVRYGLGTLFRRTTVSFRAP
ncbi:MAG: hypothetical protein ACLPQS_00790 [Acidimicrobiales bacterium]